MNDTTQTLIRSILKIGAGYLVAKGFTDDKTAEIIIAGGLGLVGVVWGIMHRRNPTPPQEPPPPRSTAPLMLLLGLALVVGAGSLPLVSCSSTPARVAYNTVNGPAVLIDSAMTAWGDYVAKFHPGAADELKVKAAFEKVQQAELVAWDAAHTYATLASSGSTNSFQAKLEATLSSQQSADALADLVSLLGTFGIKIQ